MPTPTVDANVPLLTNAGTGDTRTFLGADPPYQSYQFSQGGKRVDIGSAGTYRFQWNDSADCSQDYIGFEVVPEANPSRSSYIVEEDGKEVHSGTATYQFNRGAYYVQTVITGTSYHLPVDCTWSWAIYPPA
jgi:hypothetical protein